MNNMRLTKAGKFMMLEKDNIRYEFFTRAIAKSNLDATVAYYEPVVRYCENLVFGSTHVDRRVSANEGNKLFKELLEKGFKKVNERSFV